MKTCTSLEAAGVARATSELAQGQRLWDREKRALAKEIRSDRALIADLRARAKQLDASKRALAMQVQQLERQQSSYPGGLADIHRHHPPRPPHPISSAPASAGTRSGSSHRPRTDSSNWATAQSAAEEGFDHHGAEAETEDEDDDDDDSSSTDSEGQEGGRTSGAADEKRKALLIKLKAQKRVLVREVRRLRKLLRANPATSGGTAGGAGGGSSSSSSSSSSSGSLDVTKMMAKKMEGLLLENHKLKQSLAEAELAAYVPQLPVARSCLHAYMRACPSLYVSHQMVANFV